MKRKTVLVSALLLLQLLIPASYAADTTPPTLVEWGATIGSGDISQNDAKITVTFVIADDSKIKTPVLILKSRTTTQISGLSEARQTGESGRLKSFEASVIIKVGQAPRDWEWVLYPLSDEYGNSDNQFGPKVSNHIVTLFDSSYTRDSQLCEKNLLFYNQFLGKILNYEKQYPQFKDDFDLWRLKMQTPTEIQPSSICQGQIPVWASKFEFQITNEKLRDLADGLIAKIEAFATANAVAKTQEMKMEKALSFKEQALDLADKVEKLFTQLPSNQKAQYERDLLVPARNLAKVANKLSLDMNLDTFILQVGTTVSNLLVKYEKYSEKVPQRTTITCFKGNLTKKVSGINPKCPNGYKKK